MSGHTLTAIAMRSSIKLNTLAKVVVALERIPGIIAQYDERTAKMKADIPTLEGIMSKKWGKEDELKQLKSDLATLDRLIAQALSTQEKEHQAEIAPKQEEADSVENKHTQQSQIATTQPDQPTVDVGKKSMVAEPPSEIYRPPQLAARPFRAFGT